jgi:hypothetical protein
MENTVRLLYKGKLVNAIDINNRCLLWKSYETHKYIFGQNTDFLNITAGGRSIYSYHHGLKG